MSYMSIIAMLSYIIEECSCKGSLNMRFVEAYRHGGVEFGLSIASSNYWLDGGNDPTRHINANFFIINSFTCFPDILVIDLAVQSLTKHLIASETHFANGFTIKLSFHIETRLTCASGNGSRAPASIYQLVKSITVTKQHAFQ